jgi:hypothetical protein
MKMPPLTLCRQTPRPRHGPLIEYDGEIPSLNCRLLREYLLSWNLEGTILRAPQVTTWWLPYNKIAIMRYGHTVNSAIPEDPNEAEFPDEPWPDDVMIRIKSHPSLQVPPTALFAGDPSQASPPSGPPTGWQGPALGQAQPISADAAGLVDYTSANVTRTVEGQQEEPPDEELQAFRGESKKDHLIHAMISWATLESYPLRIGVSLPVVNPALEDGEAVFHEAQLWEETEEQWIIEEKDAEYVYSWLSERFKARSSTKMLPMGMPESVDEMAIQTSRDGGYGYILFAPEDSLSESMKKLSSQLLEERLNIG